MAKAHYRVLEKSFIHNHIREEGAVVYEDIANPGKNLLLVDEHGKPIVAEKKAQAGKAPGGKSSDNLI
jgi:hypothetical protein